MFETAEWISLALVSCGAAGGKVMANLRADMRRQRLELARLRAALAKAQTEHKDDIRECRAYIQQILRSLATGGQQ